MQPEAGFLKLNPIRVANTGFLVFRWFMDYRGDTDEIKKTVIINDKVNLIYLFWEHYISTYVTINIIRSEFFGRNQ